MMSIKITECTFINCTFSQSQFKASTFRDCTFEKCDWMGLNFDASHWSRVSLLECRGQQITGGDLQGKYVDFTGSQFEAMQLTNALIN